MGIRKRAGLALFKTNKEQQTPGIYSDSGCQNKASTVSVTVRFFAKARELTGRSSVMVQVPETLDCGKPVATLDSLLKSLVKSFPSIGPFLPVCAVALNRQYLDMDELALRTALASGDQVSIMPPVSG